MLILLDCRPLQDAGAKSERARFILACIAALTERHGVEWLFLLDRKRADLLLPEGGKRLVRSSLPGRPGTRLWYGWLLPRAARQYKADLVMTTDGRPAGGTRTPQCGWTLSGKGFTLACSGKMVQVPPAPVEGLLPLLPDEREKVKGEIAGGKEYFFSDITGVEPSGVLNLLKAFSLFKKRQLSNMKLVLAGAGNIENLDSYKYRQDVMLYPETRKDQVEGAYAAISLPHRNNLGLDILNAWEAGVPVITTSLHCIPGMDGLEEAILRVPAGDPMPLAEGLKSIYKDEVLWNELIGKGNEFLAGFSLHRSVAAIWGVLGKGDGH
jgi:hypothetical protein